MFSYQCYNRYSASTTTVELNGCLSGYDHAESAAVCPDSLEHAKSMCAAHSCCFSFAYAPLTGRTFFNFLEIDSNGNVQPAADDSCLIQMSENSLGVKSEYNLYYQHLDSYLSTASSRRRLQAVGDEASVYTASGDLGYSWDNLLRFRYVKFRSGGSFKVCMCDEDLLPEGSICKAASDYKVTVGELHVSGVECLVEKSRFQRGTCVQQYWGGLRCYSGSPPSLAVEGQTADQPASLVTQQMSNVLQDQVLTTFCTVLADVISHPGCAAYDI